MRSICIGVQTSVLKAMQMPRCLFLHTYWSVKSCQQGSPFSCCTRHGAFMESKAVKQTLQRISVSLAMMLEPGRPADQSNLWVLRCAAELAAAWPDAVQRAKTKERPEGLSDPRGLWQVLFSSWHLPCILHAAPFFSESLQGSICIAQTLNFKGTDFLVLCLVVH